ncbi:MAG TPA: VCBS repeat-containing protein, partial [Planctomycetota bacterium]|nr:VCBS repeat-containing protein [Planctomycetota bacterium]
MRLWLVVSVGVVGGRLAAQTPVFERPEYRVGIGTTSLGAIVGADLNGDGRTDLLLPCSDSNEVAVLLAIGPGAFAAPARYAVGATPRDVAVADFDLDGDLDLVVPSEASTLVS